MTVPVEHLYDAYTHTMNTVLKFPCTLQDADMDKIHENILAELVRVGQDQNIELEDLRTRVLFENAKRKNRRRQFAFRTNKPKTQGRYTFPIKEECEVISGKDNQKVLKAIRSWLCNFGDVHNRFSWTIYGNFKKMATPLKCVIEELEVDSLIPDILIHRLSKGSLWETSLDSVVWGVAHYIQVPPIEVEFLFHEPFAVTGDLLFTTQVIQFSLGDETFETNMPFISEKSSLKVTFDGELEYSVTKGVYIRKWMKIVSLGITAAFDMEKTVNKVHKVQLRMKYKADKLKIRKKIQINISSESAEKLMEQYKIYEAITKTKKKTYREQVPVNDAKVLVDCHEPWRKFVQAMREGGPKAFNEMVSKKPLVLKDLPKDINNVAGIAFEELQIARVMAEAKRKNIPLELYAGDGLGVFQFNGNEIQTPEYVDAVFLNKRNGNYYAVQFKFANDSGSLVEMMNDWRTTHEKKQPRPGTVPEALHLNNVQLIGPKEVVDQMVNLGQFKRKIDLGFEHTPIEREAIIKFIENNTEALQNIVKDENVQVCREMKIDLGRESAALAKKAAGIQAAYAKLTDGGLTPRREENIRTEIRGKEKNYKKFEVKYLEKKQKFENKHKSLQRRIRNEMTKGVLKTGMKHILKSAVVGLITDGVISLIISGDTAIKKYFNGDISGGECAWHIIKQTSLGCVRGGVISAALCGPEVASQVAAYTGYSTVGAVLLPFAKLTSPALMAGMVFYSKYNINKQLNDGDITSADSKKATCRLAMSSSLSTVGMFAAGSLIGGPFSLVIGAGFTIAVAVGDFYLGDKLWGLIIKENPDEMNALFERKQKAILDGVLKTAYEFFYINEYASDSELKEVVKAARSKYHPDKNGNAEIFKAVQNAYKMINKHRQVGNKKKLNSESKI